jgi:hypothetical protein
MTEKPIFSYTPSAEYRFWLYDPEEGMTYYRTAEDRDKAAAEAIACYHDDGWLEDVEDVAAGEVTHFATQTNRIERPSPDEIDEEGFDKEGNYWDPDWEYRCGYELLPILPPRELPL